MTEPRRAPQQPLSEEVFENVMALYTALKGNPKNSVRRADFKQGSVPAEPIDFLADVEIKARRTLTPVYYSMLLRMAEADQCDLLPLQMKRSLGLVFLKNRLGETGDYRTLYFRVKNQQLREAGDSMPYQFPEEDIAEDILNGTD